MSKTISERISSFALVTLSLFTVQQSYCQVSEQKSLSIRARLVSNKSHRGVGFAHITNKSNQTVALSDSAGIFSIAAHRNDTLFLISLGYYSKYVMVTDSLISPIRIPEITMTEQVYALKQIDLYLPKTYREFKLAVLNVKVNDVEKSKPKAWQFPGALPKLANDRFSIPLGGPVTALYTLFSKEAKAMKRLEKRLAVNKQNEIVDAKYNKDLVIRLTGLAGEQLEQFMKYCKPDDSFVIQANDYDICNKIAQCYASFLEEVKKK
jgi:hypothetical protein